MITALRFVAMIQNTKFVVLLGINMTNAFPVRCIIIFCFVFWLCSLFSKLRSKKGKGRHEESCYGVKVFVLWRGDSGFNAQPPAAKQLPLCGASGVTGRSQCCHTRSSDPITDQLRISALIKNAADWCWGLELPLCCNGFHSNLNQKHDNRGSSPDLNYTSSHTKTEVLSSVCLHGFCRGAVSNNRCCWVILSRTH